LWRVAGSGHEQSFEQTNIGREFVSFVKVIASIEDPAVIQKILAHLDAKGTHADLLPQCRAPPVIGFSPGV
jgi:hypothetical protein